MIPASTRVVTFVARSLDRLRGFDRFFTLANALLRGRADVVCVVVGEPIVRRGLDVVFHNRDYPAHLMATRAARTIPSVSGSWDLRLQWLSPKC